MLGIGPVDTISLADARRIAAARVNELREKYPEPTGFDRLKPSLMGSAAPVVTAPVVLTIPTFAEVVETAFDRKPRRVESAEDGTELAEPACPPHRADAR